MWQCFNSRNWSSTKIMSLRYVIILGVSYLWALVGGAPVSDIYAPNHLQYIPQPGVHVPRSLEWTQNPNYFYHNGILYAYGVQSHEPHKYWNTKDPQGLKHGAIPSSLQLPVYTRVPNIFPLGHHHDHDIIYFPSHYEKIVFPEEDNGIPISYPYKGFQYPDNSPIYFPSDDHPASPKNPENSIPTDVSQEDQALDFRPLIIGGKSKPCPKGHKRDHRYVCTPVKQFNG